MGKSIPGTGDDQREGLAERSLNTSIVHPDQSGPDQSEQGHAAAGGDRVLADNQQREGQEKTDPDRPKADDRFKP